MNKLLGFYELKDLELPTIPWEKYDENVQFDDSLLWTIRTAIYRGNDLNLPRKVGVRANEAKEFAEQTMKRLGDNGIVVYYPFFVAEKSGTLNVFNDRNIIEAVKDDLWNLVTYSDREVTIIASKDTIEFNGNREFITQSELSELISYVKYINRTYRDDLLSGKSVLLEWSYAYSCDINKQKIGERYLVFYEARTI